MMSGKADHWQQKDARLLQLREQGVSYVDIAKLLDVWPTGARRRWLTLHGRSMEQPLNWQPSVDLIRIRETCAAAFGLSDDRITGRSRVRDIASARQATAFVLREVRPKLSLECIGTMLGGIDHTTVIHAIRQTKARAARDAALANTIAGLITLFTGRRDVRQHDAHVVAWREWRRLSEIERTRAILHRMEQQRRIEQARREAAVGADYEYREALDQDRRWCAQCDRSVRTAEAARCTARLCALRPALAMVGGRAA